MTTVKKYCVCVRACACVSFVAHVCAIGTEKMQWKLWRIRWASFSYC